MARTIIALSVFFGTFIGVTFAGDVVVSEAWSRATAPGQKVAGVYFDIVSSTDARLVGVETGLTDVAEIHLMSMDDGVMRMRAVPAVKLPAGETVVFKPGGYHVMLFDLQQPLVAGDEIALDLLIEEENGQRTKVAAVARVRNLDGSKVERHQH